MNINRFEGGYARGKLFSTNLLTTEMNVSSRTKIFHHEITSTTTKNYIIRLIRTITRLINSKMNKILIYLSVLF